MTGFTTIMVSTDTRDRLRSLGKKGESYETVLKRLLDAFEGVLDWPH